MIRESTNNERKRNNQDSYNNEQLFSDFTKVFREN